jgi:nucleoside 2-deoxyribosyltransferase
VLIQPGSDSEKRRVYIASPHGFTEAGRRYLVTIKDVLVGAGLHPHDPWDMRGNPIPAARSRDWSLNKLAELARANAEVGYYNEVLIRFSQGLLAVLDGSDVDSGTSAEIGFASALGKPVVGLREDTRVTGDDEGAIVNLQVERFIYSSGGTIAESLEDAAALLRAILDSPGTRPPDDWKAAVAAAPPPDGLPDAPTLLRRGQ